MQIQVQIFNNTDKDIRCSGPVYIYSQMGKFKTEFYSNIIYKGMMDNHYIYFYGLDMNDRISNYSNGIFCNEF